MSETTGAPVYIVIPFGSETTAKLGLAEIQGAGYRARVVTDPTTCSAILRSDPHRAGVGDV